MTQKVAAETNGPSNALSEAERDWYQLYGIRHLALIPDGNRRWAKKKGLPVAIGHAQGLLHVLPNLVHKLCDAGVHTLTVWAFSTENWTREAEEVKHLMNMSAEFLRRQMLDIAARHDARICHLGRKDRLFPAVMSALENAEKVTANNRSHVLNLALDYGGRDELLRASMKLVEAQSKHEALPSLQLSDFLDTKGQPYPDPDVVIRSSGEHRMSGFLPVQAAYAELFFVDELFPEFTFDTVRDVAEQFRWRKRRFGS
jgi:undecaprenyl diphosphate synthase